jgi:hypothetical protein
MSLFEHMTDHWRAAVNSVMKLPFSLKGGEICDLEAFLRASNTSASQVPCLL